MLHTETVEARTLALLKKLINDKELQSFHLAGGTALALQFGHRKSIDIDLFTDQDFDATRLANHLLKHYGAADIGINKNGVFSKMNNVKVDILAHQYPLVNSVKTTEGVRMLSLEDIGAMKLNVILYNGTRLKDFADFYKLLEHLPLKKLTNAFIQKYPNVNTRMAHAGLLYHQDVNMKEKIDFIGNNLLWEEISSRLREAVANEQKIFPAHEVKQKQQKSIFENPRPDKQKRKGNRPKL